MAGRLALDGRKGRGDTLVPHGAPLDAEEAGERLPFDPPGFESRLAWMLGSPRTGSTWLLRLLIHPWILARGPATGMRAPLRLRRGRLPSVVPIDESYLLHHLAPLRSLPAELEEQPRTDQFVINGMRRSDPGYFFNDEYAHSWRPELRRLILARLHAQADRAARKHSLSDPLVLIKEPNGSHGAELLMSLLPRSRMIFLLRDGRDVVDSVLDARGGNGWTVQTQVDLSDAGQRLAYVRRQARLWLNCTNAVQSAYEAHPPELRWLVRYEDLRRDTLAALRPLVGWLGLSSSDEELRDAIDANAFESIPGWLKGPGTPRRAAKSGLWRENMTPGEQEAMEEIIGPKLADLGYEAG
jgi:hypothetical protein